MSRLPALPPERLTPDQRALYDAIATGPRAAGPQHFALTAGDGSLTGPFNALLYSPALGQAVQSLGAAVRYRSALGDRERELAILVVAVHWGSDFEVRAHEAVGRAAGVTDAELAAVRGGGLPELPDPHEAAVLALTHAMARGDVDDDLWIRARNVVTAEEAFEVSTLVGYYALLALQLRVFRVDPPALA